MFILRPKIVRTQHFNWLRYAIGLLLTASAFVHIYASVISTGAHRSSEQLFHISHREPRRFRLRRRLRQAVGPEGAAIRGGIYEPVPGDGGVLVEGRSAGDERRHRQRHQGFRRTKAGPRIHHDGAQRHGYRCVCVGPTFFVCCLLWREDNMKLQRPFSQQRAGSIFCHRAC